MAEDLQTIETKRAAGRLAAAALILGALAFGWFAVRWQLGNMLAALNSPNDPNAKAIAEMAHSLSPSDPIANWFRANVEKESFTADGLERAVADLERAVRRAPADYRYWIELGRAYEQTDRFDAAEKALRRAVELAPNYSNANWHLGNFYLRRGNDAAAFPALRRAAETSAVYSEQVFGVIWDFYEKDKAKLDELAGDRADLRAGLAKFYAMKEQAADSLRVWNTLPEAEKTRHADVARLIAQALYDKRFYRSAIEFIRQLGIEPQAQAEAVQNGGFEAPVAAVARESYFGWQVTKKEKMEVGPDSMKKKEGNKSLRVGFNGFSGVELRNVQQIVVVEAGRKYRVSFFLKTENLKSAGTPTLEVVNANDGKIVAASAPFPAGTQDWTPVAVEFAVPDGAEAVALRFDRVYCGDACPIVGAFWVDDFKLERTN